MSRLTEEEIADRIKGAVEANKILEIDVPRARRIFVLIAKSAFRKAMEYVVEDEGFAHISTITGVDAGKKIEVIYHLSRGGIELSLKVRVPKGKAVLPTVTDLIPGSVLYEREVHDLLGVEFEGHPDLAPLILPEEWPEDVYPLRKEWTTEKIQEKIMEGRKP